MQENILTRLAKKANRFLLKAENLSDAQLQAADKFAARFGVSPQQAQKYLQWFFDLANGFITLEEFEVDTDIKLTLDASARQLLEQIRREHLIFLMVKLQEHGFTLDELKEASEKIAQNPVQAEYLRRRYWQNHTVTDYPAKQKEDQN